MTNGGGAGVMAADAAAALGVDLMQPGAALTEELDRALPANWSRANPIDIIGDAPVDRYTSTLRSLLAEPGGGTVLLTHAPTAIVRSEDLARACVPLVREARGRVMSCWLGDGAVAAARRMFEEAGVADYATPEEAVQAFALLQTYRRNQETLLETPAASENPAPDAEAARGVIAQAVAQGREWLSEHEAKAVLAAYGIPVVRTVPVPASAAAAADAARDLGFPVVLKIRSPEITHKSDVGGVRLDLRDAQAVAGAAEQMLAAVRAARPDARIDGFTVQPMVHRPHARELIVGARVDATFGPVILFGQGGIAVEVTSDSAVALPPLNRSLAGELVSRTRVSRLLAAYRDQPPVKQQALQDTLLAVSQMLADQPQLAELDINPLWADDEGVLAPDARIRVSALPVGGEQRFAIRPYPAEWAQALRWQDRDITVRPIRPEDEPQHRRFIEQLDAQDIRLRIFQTRRELPHSELARLTQIDYEREMAFIAVEAGEDGSQHTLGVARAVRDPDNVEAEFAVIVRSDMKRRGLGRLLMGRLIEYVRAQGTRRLVGLVLRENQGMLALARETGFVVEAEPGAWARRDEAVKVVLLL
jgi:acetyltransferase